MAAGACPRANTELPDRMWRKFDFAKMRPVTAILTGALLLGTIGFCAGFFGPIILTPEANQGPLLGIFITGPLGAILGLVLWVRRKTPDNSRDIPPRIR